MRSAVALPSADTYVPAAQLDHGMHASTFVAAENVPAPQLSHVRSDVALPADATYVPAPQIVHAVQESTLLPAE